MYKIFRWKKGVTPRNGTLNTQMLLIHTDKIFINISENL